MFLWGKNLKILVSSDWPINLISLSNALRPKQLPAPHAEQTENFCQISSKFKFRPTPAVAATTSCIKNQTTASQLLKIITLAKLPQWVGVCVAAYLYLCAVSTCSHAHLAAPTLEKLKSHQQVEPFVIYKRLNHKKAKGAAQRQKL